MGHSDIDAAVEREMRRRQRSEHVPYPDDPTPQGDYGDRGECAVCGRPLDRPPEPDGLLFCGEHGRDDLRARERHADERREQALRERHVERESTGSHDEE